MIQEIGLEDSASFEVCHFMMIPLGPTEKMPRHMGHSVIGVDQESVADNFADQHKSSRTVLNLCFARSIVLTVSSGRG